MGRYSAKDAGINEAGRGSMGEIDAGIRQAFSSIHDRRPRPARAAAVNEVSQMSEFEGFDVEGILADIESDGPNGGMNPVAWNDQWEDDENQEEEGEDEDAGDEVAEEDQKNPYVVSLKWSAMVLI